MKPQGEDAFKKWAKLEEQKRTKEDKVKRRKEVKQLRRFYLGSTEDATFEMDWNYCNPITRQNDVIYFPEWNIFYIDCISTNVKFAKLWNFIYFQIDSK